MMETSIEYRLFGIVEEKKQKDNFEFGIKN
jgi:hypothetical protein